MADIVERIKRLLALSTSSNVNEAAAAAAKAAELMAKHQIDQATVEADADAPDEAIETEDFIALGGKVQPWKMYLGRALARANGCAMYQQVRGGLTRQVKLRIIGPKRAADTCRYMLAYLTNEVERLLKLDVARQQAAWAEMGVRFAGGRSYAGSFRLGAAKEISERIETTAAETMLAARETANATAIVRLDRTLERVDEVKASLGLTPHTTRATYSNSAAFRAGQEAGRGVALSSRAALGAGSKGSLSG